MSKHKGSELHSSRRNRICENSHSQDDIATVLATELMRLRDETRQNLVRIASPQRVPQTTFSTRRPVGATQMQEWSDRHRKLARSVVACPTLDPWQLYNSAQTQAQTRRLQTCWRSSQHVAAERMICRSSSCSCKSKRSSRHCSLRQLSCRMRRCRCGICLAVVNSLLNVYSSTCHHHDPACRLRTAGWQL